MKRQSFPFVTAFIIGCLLVPAVVFAGDDETYSGQASLWARKVDGAQQSAKFQEYRDVPSGATGYFYFKFTNKDGYHLDLTAKNIAQKDQFTDLGLGKFGQFKFGLSYDMIPHRFAYDARTIFSGIGTDNLVIPLAVRTDISGAKSGTDLVNRLSTEFNSTSTAHDIQYFRKKFGASGEYTGLQPFTFRLEYGSEKREGTKPSFGSFGLNSTVELAEPVNYKTDQVRAVAEYAKKPFVLSVNYYVSIFDNHNDMLRWDNPFRATDSTASNAYQQTYLSGPTSGLIDLTPNNRYYNLSLAGVVVDLPGKSQFTANASWGWMTQADATLKPYTTNTAIKPGAAADPPFDASQQNNLPSGMIDARVMTTLYNFRFTSKPMDFVHFTAKYRLYQWDNQSRILEFPGYVRTDAVWVSGEPVSNQPTSYDKHNATIEAGFDVWKHTMITVGYNYDSISRVERESERQHENQAKFAFDSKPCEWMDIHASYERSSRTGDYDYTIPYEGATITGALPWLRKYDEADRTRDNFKGIFTFYPIDKLTLAATLDYSKDDYRDSIFGLLWDKRYSYAFDLSYTPVKAVELSGYYIYENFRNYQLDRQWNPSGGLGDPYFTDTTIISYSNWDATNRDRITTYGYGFKWDALPDKLETTFNYTYTRAKGNVDFSSPKGTTANDINPYDYLNYNTADCTALKNIHAKIDYNLSKKLTLGAGFMWEKYETNDYNNVGLTYIPVSPSTGLYQGALLMETLPKPYLAKIYYAKVSYRF